MQRQITLSHTFYEGVNSSFIVVGCERSRQPEAEGPCRRKRRLTGQGSIFADNLFNRRSFNYEIFEALSSYAELGFFTFFRSDFIRNQLRMVNKYAVAFAGYIERNVLVGLLRAGTTIFVPEINNLSVLHKRSEALAQPVYIFAYADIQLFTHERVAVLIGNVSHGFETAAGNALFTAVEVYGPMCAFVDDNTESAADQHGLCFGFFDLYVIASSLGQLKSRSAVNNAVIVNDLHAYHTRKRGMEFNSKERGVQRCRTSCNWSCLCNCSQTFSSLFHYIILHCAVDIDPFANQPKAVCKFHVCACHPSICCL